MMLTWSLLAAEARVRTTFEWGRIQSNSDWILPIAVLILLLLFVRYMYRRDAVELPRPLGWFLTALRTIVFLALFILWLQPQWRTEEQKVIPSRALVLVDTSLSMGLNDADNGSTQATSRLRQVAQALKQSDFLDRLRKTHDVVVGQFDEELHRDRVLTLPRAKDESPPVERPAASSVAKAAPADTATEAPTDWEQILALSGEETRLGQSVRQLLSDHANAPTSAVIVISDGGQNAGPGPDFAAEAAKELGVRIFTVGVGSEHQPPSVRVAAFNPPPRAYPGDPYTISGVVQAWRMPGRTIQVQLLSRPAANGAPDPSARGSGELIDSQQVTLGTDGEEVPVKFEVTTEEIGRRTLSLKIDAPENDRERDDNLMEADIEIVDRKIRVLLLAGGPSRDYQFLRDQLHRDKTVISDIVLQSGQLGISQDANKILDDFPTTREELYEYDCVVAFDPDWTQLSAEQVDLLETWVAEQGGGLVVTTGPVNAGRAINSWVQDASPPMSKVRNLYPVEFPRRFSAVESKPYESDESWPLDFTREGIEADFLQITDSAVDSRRAWEAFPGVYGYFPVRGPKQGATVLARFSDPQTSQAGEQPVFLAWQFYGSGRVLFMGSAEFYRLRSEDTRYFEQFYIKLVRHISKGRLLRGSTRGMLLVGQERYRLGNTVSVQAYRLTNAQLEPLELPSVDLQVMEPDQSVQTVAMRPDPTRVGTYLGQFPVLKEGEYRLELPLPDSSDERLTQRILVEIPNLERERPQRNDAVLSQLAQTTGGQYFVGLSAILDPSIPLVSQLDDRTKTITLTASLSKEWEEQWLWWAMLALMGLLSLEWLLRRLFRLA